MIKCIIYKTSIFSEVDLQNSQNIEIYNPQAGGIYKVSTNLYHQFYPKNIFNGENNKEKELSDILKTKISGFIASENLKGKVPFLKNDIFEKPPDIIKVSSTRANLLLQAFVKRSKHIGDVINININANMAPLVQTSSFDIKNQIKAKANIISNMSDQDFSNFLYPLSYSKNSKEIHFLIKELEKSGFIKIESDYTGGALEIVVEQKGYNEFKNKKQLNRKKEVFVAMWFDSSMKILRENLKQSIEKSGYKPIIIDEKPHINKIDDEIIENIKQSAFMVCDLTSEKEKPRGSVYFEAGYAFGIEIPVIFTCRLDMIDEMPFDIRQYNCLDWKQSESNHLVTQDGTSFTEELTKRIQENIKS